MNFDEAFDKLIGHEGGFSSHPEDPGGSTKWGVTQRVAVRNGYRGDMRDFPRDTAKAIYRQHYWDGIRAEELPAALRFHVFDAAVNSGVRQAIKWLQRAVGVGDDGVIGPMTIEAANKANPLAVAAVLTGERLDLMTSLPNWGAFGKGWTRRIASNLKDMA
jgi:lysozyme family protein